MTFHLFDRIAAEEEGEGDVVVCVHGLGGTSNSFTPLMPVLARFRVLRIDLPGSGRSHRVEGALSMQRMVDALLTVCARLNVERAHWVGHSMGTIVLQHLAVAQPKCVKSLVLFGALPAPPDAARAALRTRAAKARSEGVGGMQAIAESLVLAATSADTRARLPGAIAFVRESLMRQDPDAYARSCEALADAMPAAIERIDVPTLLVTGGDDAVAPPQVSRAISERMPNARVVVLPRCGHWTPVERPEECARELRDFLAAQRN
jgi:3-oxoadipate enol-lactonase